VGKSAGQLHLIYATSAERFLTHFAALSQVDAPFWLRFAFGIGVDSPNRGMRLVTSGEQSQALSLPEQRISERDD
jgi:hypothetical protein